MLSKLAVALLITTSPAWSEPVTIAALGDSLTAGYGLPQGDGFVPQMQAWLEGQGADVSLINAGVSGDTTAGGLSRVAWTLSPDVDAMIVNLGGNDFLRGIDPAVSRSNLEQILAQGQAAEVEMLLIGLSVGANYGADYRDQFAAMYADLAADYGILFYPDYAAALRAAAASQSEMADYLQPDGIHPNAAGVKMIVEDLGPLVLELATQAAQPPSQ